MSLTIVLYQLFSYLEIKMKMVVVVVVVFLFVVKVIANMQMDEED
jgi:hypothetical protein